ncbi:MAG: hypothetical protein ACPHOZ_06750, partial [Candidatus Puniceispirillaceae bacterium]
AANMMKRLWQSRVETRAFSGSKNNGSNFHIKFIIGNTAECQTFAWCGFAFRAKLGKIIKKEPFWAFFQLKI